MKKSFLDSRRGFRGARGLQWRVHRLCCYQRGEARCVEQSLCRKKRTAHHLPLVRDRADQPRLARAFTVD